MKFLQIHTQTQKYEKVITFVQPCNPKSSFNQQLSQILTNFSPRLVRGSADCGIIFYRNFYGKTLMGVFKVLKIRGQSRKAFSQSILQVRQGKSFQFQHYVLSNSCFSLTSPPPNNHKLSKHDLLGNYLTKILLELTTIAKHQTFLPPF